MKGEVITIIIIFSGVFIYFTKFNLNQRVKARESFKSEGIIIISQSITQMLRHFTEEKKTVTCWWHYRTLPGITEVLRIWIIMELHLIFQSGPKRWSNCPGIPTIMPHATTWPLFEFPAVVKVLETTWGWWSASQPQRPYQECPSWCPAATRSPHLKDALKHQTGNAVGLLSCNVPSEPPSSA